MKRVIVIGDYMDDVYIHCTIDRMSPEAPVPVLLETHREYRRGAAGYVGDLVVAFVGKQHLVGMSSYSVRSDDCVTKARFMVDGRHLFRHDIDAAQEPIKTSHLRNLDIDADSIVVFSDYGKGTLDNIIALTDYCKARGATVLIDPKARAQRHYANADMIKPNRTEMQRMIGVWESDDELRERALMLMRANGIRYLLLTLGRDGMRLFDWKGTTNVYDAQPVQAKDVCGAGDAAMAAFAAALWRGCSYEIAATYAQRAASIAVTRFGSAMLTKQEVFGDE